MFFRTVSNCHQATGQGYAKGSKGLPAAAACAPPRDQGSDDKMGGDNVVADAEGAVVAGV